MSAPLRFLTVTLLAWGGLRAVTLGSVSGFTVSHAASIPPAPIVPSDLTAPAAMAPAAEPVGWDEPAAAYPAAAGTSHDPRYFAYARPPAYARPYPVPYFVPAYAPAERRSSSALLEPRRAWSLAPAAFAPAAGGEPFAYTQLPPLVPSGGVVQRSLPAAAAEPAAPTKLDRWQLASWALLRGAPAPGALATGGTLGGSQGGVRITYAFNRSLAASLRLSSPLGGSRGTEIAGGVRWVPLRSLPVAITAERRQSLGRGAGGRSDFALFAEAGLYRRPMLWRFELDAYAQAGVVGLTERDLFADGALAFTRPVFGRFSAGFGAWGGYQPGLYRIDAGPRLSYRVRDNIRLHVDWRQRLAGNAQPMSGPALTLAADF